MNRKGSIRITFNAPVTISFVFICLIVTIAGMITGGGSTRLFFMTYHSSLLNPLTYLRLITHVFGHSGLAHFMGNAAYLLILGPMIEEKYGSKPLMSAILITAVITGLFNYIVFPAVGLCGASGVVFLFILLASFTGFKEGEIPLTFILVVLIFIGQQVIEGITVNDNVSNTAHILGGIVGSVIGYKFNKK